MNCIHKRWKLAQLYYRRFRVWGLAKSARVLLRPDSVVLHVRRFFLGSTEGSNFYVPSASRADEMRFCRQVLNCDEAAVEKVFKELEEDRTFVDRLSSHYQSVRPDSPIAFNIGRFKVWYAIVRLCKPRVVLETGVHDGLSSTLILRALSRNGQGSLISIDLPAIDLPFANVEPGWLVPDELKSRWHLHLCDSRDLLPILARKYAPIDVFIHDSDHRADFQRFEYQTVMPFLSTTGLLLTDDAIPRMFCELGAKWGTRAMLVPGSTPETGIVLGGIRFGNSD
jgi:Methyltransferase domain